MQNSIPILACDNSKEHLDSTEGCAKIGLPVQRFAIFDRAKKNDARQGIASD